MAALQNDGEEDNAELLASRNRRDLHELPAERPVLGGPRVHGSGLV